MTLAEIQEYVTAVNDQKRSESKIAAEIAYVQASLTIQMLNGGKDLPDLADAFPGIWTEEEIKQAKIAKYQKRMMAWQGVRIEK